MTFGRMDSISYFVWPTLTNVYTEIFFKHKGKGRLRRWMS